MHTVLLLGSSSLVSVFSNRHWVFNSRSMGHEIGRRVGECPEEEPASAVSIFTILVSLEYFH